MLVANGQTRMSQAVQDVTMAPIQEDVAVNVRSVTSSDLCCPHCNFRCDSTALMTQHSWEQHPLLMRRKKHLINTSKVDATDETTGVSKDSTSTIPPPVIQTAQKMKDCSLSSNDACPVSVPVSQATEKEQKHMEYREKAMRSLSLLSTAAAILENQSNQVPEYRVPVLKPSPTENVQSTQLYPREGNQPVFASVYRAYLPTLNQYVTLPLSMAPMNLVPNRNIPAANVVNSFAFLDSQQSCPSSNTQFNRQLPQNYPYYAPKSTRVASQTPQKPASDEIRNLLKCNGATIPRQESNILPVKATKCAKQEKKSSKRALPANPNLYPMCHLDEERQKQLEQALLSTDYCDINDSSMTMPFKCSDGVWKMVKFKCVKGLWVVQTPDSATPTVYVPCDDEVLEEKPAGRAGRSLSDASRHKRKLSDDLESDIDAKRLCASAPVPYTEGDGRFVSSTGLKRTLSNPFITTALPPPSKQFTNNEGKRVNISMIKRGTPRNYASCDLLKSLLLRKPSPQPLSPSHRQSSSSSVSSLDTKSSADSNVAKNATPERHLAATITKTWLKSSMAF